VAVLAGCFLVNWKLKSPCQTAAMEQGILASLTKAHRVKSKSTVHSANLMVAQLSVLGLAEVWGAKKDNFYPEVCAFTWDRLAATISRVVGINV